METDMTHSRIRYWILAPVAALLFFGCASQYETDELSVAENAAAPPKTFVNIDPDRPFMKTGVPGFLAVANADLEKKKKYIADAKRNLAKFRLVAENARRLKIKIDNELVRESDRYVRRYVIPLLNDTEVAADRETAFDIAKLHLLSTLLYCDVGSFAEAERFAGKFGERYGEDSVLLTRKIHENDVIGFHSIREGLGHVRKQLAR